MLYYMYMLIHFDIVCVDFQHLTELVDVAIESILAHDITSKDIFLEGIKAW